MGSCELICKPILGIEIGKTFYFMSIDWVFEWVEDKIYFGWEEVGKKLEFMMINIDELEEQHNQLKVRTN